METKIFRPIKKSDIPFLVDFGKINFSEIYKMDELECLLDELNLSFDEYVYQSPNFFMVELGDIILGFGGFFNSPMDDGLYEIVWINVNNKYRNQNIGSFIVENLINEIKQIETCKKDVTIILSCQNHLEKFYSGLGFSFMLKKASNNEILMGLSFLK
jgi:ribosomal protein S18 acetylase RimI-like enzyme